ncbi:MAG TPA: glycosyltransferase family 2 protein [Candidatus Moranbacteria bacterium]|nr:glycosyltransferase family 2 protein [Candidatus Moranbacteria bacterium]
MKLSFIIVNYQSREYLEKCVASVFDCVQNIDFEIIVVNNDEFFLDDLYLNDGFSKNVIFSRLSLTHGSSKKKQFFEKPTNDNIKTNLKIIEVNENVGFGRGCNLGAKEASGEILCFLNPDTEIISKNISDIIEIFEQKEGVGIVGPKIIKKSGELQKWTMGRDLTLLRTIKNNLGFIDDKKLWSSNKKQEVDWVTGAVLFIRKKIFEKIDGFDEKFFMYFEDIDLCKRARLEKYKVMYFPSFIVRHIEGGSAKNRLEQKKEYYKSQDYYFEKWFSKKTSSLVKFLRKFHF